MTEIPSTMQQLRSLVTPDGAVVLSIETVPTPPPGPGQVLIRVEAAPINPSDMGLLLAMGDAGELVAGGTPESPTITIPLGPGAIAATKARLGQSMAAGNEGSGTVVAAGEGVDAALVGRVVGFFGGESYAEYRAVPAAMCLPMPDGVTAAQAASCVVNPFTALSMVENMRLDGFTGLVHTAAASNLGQMLNRICLAEDVPLVNIVRRPEQADLLRSQGAAHVCDSSTPTFADDLTAALVETGATLAFDATGGGTLAGQILTCMEAAAVQRSAGGAYSRYGSDVFKQVYIYGGLDRSPTVLNRTFGFSWSVSGWLLTPFLGRIGAEGMARLGQRVTSEITTTFASHYTDEVSLAGMLAPDTVRSWARQTTGQKYLVRPHG